MECIPLFIREPQESQKDVANNGEGSFLPRSWAKVYITSVRACNGGPCVQIEQRLLYQQGQAWSELPDWASFHLKFAQDLYTAAPPMNRLVVGLALPTRAFAAAMLATGLAAKAAPRFELDRHFAGLCSLPKKEPLQIYNFPDQIWYPGISDGTVKSGSELLLRVLTSRDGPAMLVRQSGAARVRHAPQGQRLLPWVTSHRAMPPSEVFLNACLPTVDVNRLTADAAKLCAIIGQLNLLQAEIVETQFAVACKPGQVAQGNLQQIVRLDRWLGQGQSARATVVPPGRSDISTPQKHRFAIFDGARAFLQMRHLWPAAHWLVILDRSAPDFISGVDQLNQHFMRRVVSAERLKIQPSPGVEMMIFEEAR